MDLPARPIREGESAGNVSPFSMVLIDFSMRKHVASNSYTKYRPYPTPSQFSSSPDLISRTTTFLRRELQVWEGLDVEVCLTYFIQHYALYRAKRVLSF